MPKAAKNATPKTPVKAPEITPALANSITDVDLAFSTDRLLPAWEDIPAEFKATRGNDYTRLAEAIFYGTKLPEMTLSLHEGYTPEAMNRVVRAHLQSFTPKHEHKIAGVGYLISKMATLSREACP